MGSNEKDDSTVLDLGVLNAQGQHPRPPVHSSTQPYPLDPSKENNQGQNKGGKKDCPRHVDGHPPNKLTTRDLGNKRTVYLLYGSDVVLFDSILSFKNTNPDKTVDEAIDTFSEHQGADALANIIYRTQAFDMVLKYQIPEHLRKVPDTPPVIGLQPTVSDIEIDSTSSAARARKDEKQRQHQEAQQREKMTPAPATKKDDEKDIEAAAVDPKIQKEEKLERVRMRFRKAVLRENVIIEEEPNVDGEVMYLKLYAPFWRLCIEAERLRYKVELTHFETAQQGPAAAAAEGWWTKNFRRFLHKFDNVSLPLRAESLLFKASKLRQYALAEKQRKWSDVVRHGGGIKADGSGVGSQMGSDGQDGFFGTARRGNLIESIVIYCKVRTRRSDRHALKYVMDRKAFTGMFTLHDGSYKSKVTPTPNRRTLLYNTWVRSRGDQPLEEIRFYYGEKIALYFAWIGHYTKWLFYAAIVGFLFLIYGMINYFLSKQDPSAGVSAQLVSIFDNALTLPYALFMAVWSSMFVEYWKRKNSVLAYQWNTLDFEQRERARPEFKPTSTRISPVTGKKELYYPRYKQLVSIFISVMVVLISIAIVVVSVGSLLIFNVYLKGKGQLGAYTISVVIALMNLVVILILGTVYATLAKILTDNENHRRLTQYEDALIIKRFLFDFVNFYSALVYIAFFKESINVAQYVGRNDTCQNDSCMGELTIQLAIVFVGKQLLNQFQELAVPQLKRLWNAKSELAEKANLKGKYKSKNMVKPPQWVKDDLLPPFDNTMFEEYRELVVQFGFCTLFVTAFPIAPIFALINNVMEIRVDAYKLLTQHQRPIAQGAQDIGSWEAILMMLSHISVLTNACLIAFQSTWMEQNVFMKLPGVEAAKGNDFNYALLTVRLLFIFIFEHLVVFIKIGIANLVRDMPRTVKLAIERESYYTRLALDEVEPAIDEILEDLDADDDESDDDDDNNNWFSRFKKDSNSDEEDNSDEKAGTGTPEETAAENDEELEALIKAGGCGCAAHGDGIIGTSKGGFEGTWMSRFKPETQAALKRRQRRRRKQKTSA